MTYVRTLATREINDPDAGGDTMNPLTAFGTPHIDIPLNEAWITLAAITFVCLVGALWMFSVKEYVPRGDAE